MTVHISEVEKREFRTNAVLEKRTYEESNNKAHCVCGCGIEHAAGRLRTCCCAGRHKRAGRYHCTRRNRSAGCY